jgi:hypothetical protein
MDAHKIKTTKVDEPVSNERDEWVNMHVHQLQQLFKQWQQPIGIDSQPYRRHLEKELAGYWKDPLLKSLVETI